MNNLINTIKRNKEKFITSYFLTIFCLSTLLGGIVLIATPNVKIVEGFSGSFGTEVWNYTDGTHIGKSPLIVDVAGTLAKDIIFGGGGYIYVVSGDTGQLIWKTYLHSPLVTTPVAGDFDFDGTEDILVETAQAILYSLNGLDGNITWNYTFESSAYFTNYHLAIGDFNHDNYYEILTTIGGVGYKLCELSAQNGTSIANYTSSTYIKEFTVGDIDDDGHVEIVLSKLSNTIDCIYAENMTLKWSVNHAWFGDPVLLTDTNDDGYTEIILAGSSYIFSLSPFNGSILWNKTNPTGNYDKYSASADVNGDGYMDIVIGDDANYLSCISGRNGEFLWRTQLSSTNSTIDSPTIADINGDGILDVLINSKDNNTYALDTSNGSIFWNLTFSSYPYGSPAVVDIDLDDRLEFIVHDEDKIYCFQADGKKWAIPGGWPCEGASPRHWFYFHDTDNDLLVDQLEEYTETFSNNNDSDSDGLSDGWETTFGYNPNHDTWNQTDDDYDNLIILDEFKYKTSPRNNDTDEDGLGDSWEVTYGFNPRVPGEESQDSDHDGLNNSMEFSLNTNPLSNDSDGDGMSDGWEHNNGLNPSNNNDKNWDNDNDQLSNYEEYQLGTNPNNQDSDGDNMPDGWEHSNGLNPVSASDNVTDPDGDNLNNYNEYKWHTDP
ncbi:MAG: FG-GAP-like repeat-containing protein, partial [Promethearchaeota archaeon]